MNDDRPPVPDLDISLTPVTIRDVAFVVFVYFFWPLVVIQIMLAVGLGPGRLASPPTAEQADQFMRLKLLTDGVAFPLQLASLALLPMVTGVRPWQIGVTARRLGRNVLWGVAGWAVLTPICFAVNYAVVALYGPAAGNVHEHPFVRMAAEGLSPLEWFLLAFSASVSGPTMEELVFRGTLLAWLENRSWASHAVMGLALIASLPAEIWEYLVSPLVPLPAGWAAEWGVWSNGGLPLLLHLTPTIFVMALIAIYGMLCRSAQSPAAPAVFASSALFAAIHTFAWPSPVPLFVLALGLGWLALRTRSLAGPVVLHGLFNAVSCVLLFVKWGA